MSIVKRLGLTGGIASGKSAVARLFRDRGIPVIDMDELSRQVLETDKTLQDEVVTSMGPGILTQGKIDRRKLRQLIFTNPQKKKALESLIHPKVRSQFEDLAQEAENQGHSLVLCEAALLIESGFRNQLDGLIVVLAPEDLRRARLKSRDNLGDELIDQMFRAQVSDPERLAAATYVIRNDSSLQALEPQVEALLAIWKQQGLL